MTVPDDSFGFGVNLDTGTPVVSVFGEIDILAVPSLSGALNGLIDHGQLPIVVDLGHVTFLDARGADVIAEVGARAQRVGHTVTVRSASPFVRRILELTDATGHVVLDATSSQPAGPRTGGAFGALHGKTSAAKDIDEQQWNERFATALGARAIHQAQGIIMSRDNVAAEAALAHIMQAARARQMTAFAYASEIVSSIPDRRRADGHRHEPVIERPRKRLPGSG